MKKTILIAFIAGMFFMWLVSGGLEHAAYNDNLILKMVSLLSYVIFGLLFVWLIYLVGKFVFGGRSKDSFEEMLMKKIVEGKISPEQAECLRNERKKKRLSDLALWDD